MENIKLNCSSSSSNICDNPSNSSKRVSIHLNNKNGLIHRSVSQESFCVEVNTIFSVKGKKGFVMERKRGALISPDDFCPEEQKRVALLPTSSNETNKKPMPRLSMQNPLFLTPVDSSERSSSSISTSKDKSECTNIAEVSRKKRVRMSLSDPPPSFSSAFLPLTQSDDEEESSHISPLELIRGGKSNRRKNGLPRKAIYSSSLGQRVEEERENYFITLPDEMVLKIFKKLGKSTLAKCASVCKRFRDLAYDDCLWRRIDAFDRTLSPRSLSLIFQRNPNYLRLARSHMSFPIEMAEGVVASSLVYLDMTMSDVDSESLGAILSMCPNLRKCSLENLNLGEIGTMALHAFSSNITTLNLASCNNVDAHYFKLFLRRAKKLRELNIGFINQNWTMSVLYDVIGHVPKDLLELNLSGFRTTLTDKHVSHLVSRCQYLTSLDLSDAHGISASSLQSITSSLTSLKFLALSRCYNIPLAAYYSLSSLHSLCSLQIFSILPHSFSSGLAKELGGRVSVNREPFSTIGRPTVGNKRSSIWGQRVRD